MTTSTAQARPFLVRYAYPILLGWLAVVLSALAALALVVLAAREILGLMRLRLIDHIRSRAADAANADNRDEARAAARELVALYVARPTKPMDYWYRFAHGDDVIFVHDGTGMLETQFGTLRYGPGDYLVMATGVIWRVVPDGTPIRIEPSSDD